MFVLIMFELGTRAKSLFDFDLAHRGRVGLNMLGCFDYV